MKRKILVSVLFVLVALVGCAPRTVIKQRQATTVKETERVETKYTGPKRRVAVIDFENKTAYGQRRLGTAATDILISELGKTGKFILVERDKMQKLLEEQKLGMTGVIDPSTAARMGRILGVNAIITGAISQFGVKTGGSEYIIVQSKRQEAQATVDIRVIDVETGQILFTDSGKGITRTSSGSFLGLGTRKGYDETIEGEALRAAIVKFVDNVVNQINALPWSCRVATVEGGKIYLDAGFKSGLEKGTKLLIFHLGKEIKSPTTGLIIGRTEEEIGVIEVVSHFGEDGSIAKLKKGQLPSTGDLCRLK